VHLSTGSAALAFAYMVGKRKDTSERPPHNMTHVVLGTSFIWLGWLVANAGSGISPNLRAVTVFVTTNTSAAVGGIVWGILDYIRHGQKWSAVGFCSGAICGLVAITPASGYVSPTSSIVFGLAGSLICNFSMRVKEVLRVDDSFDVFAVHGIGGIVGNILTGVFAQKEYAGLDGSDPIPGGWLDGNYIQVVWQLIDTVAGMAWAFCWTVIILWVINKIPGCHIRADEEDERNGLDKAELGEDMYQHMEDLKNEIKVAVGVDDGTISDTRNGSKDKSATGVIEMEIVRNGDEDKNEMNIRRNGNHSVENAV
jgi:Amt family ammonium transporter